MTDKMKLSIDPEALVDALEHIAKSMESMNATVEEIREYLEQSYLEGQWEQSQQEAEEMEWLDQEVPSHLLH
jgi:hypothetical protein